MRVAQRGRPRGLRVTGSETSREPRGVRRGLFVAATALLAFLLVEGTSWILLRGLVDADVGNALRAAAVPRDRRAVAFQHREYDITRGEVIHPYVGFVWKADRNAAPLAADALPDLAELGFPFGGPLVRSREPDTLVLAVFGGSAAAMFTGEKGPERLFAGLERAPGLAGKRLVLLSAAQGGYKQPQQLLALAYLLSLGVQIDVLVLLDGFNEVALAPVENTPRGVFPFFPRSGSSAPPISATRRRRARRSVRSPT